MFIGITPSRACGSAKHIQESVIDAARRKRSRVKSQGCLSLVVLLPASTRKHDASADQNQ